MESEEIDITDTNILEAIWQYVSKTLKNVQNPPEIRWMDKSIKLITFCYISLMDLTTVKSRRWIYEPLLHNSFHFSVCL